MKKRPPVRNTETLIAARKRWRRATFGKGAACPCCGRFARRYKRQVTSSMARWLIQLVRRHIDEPRWLSVSEDWSKLIGCHDMGKLLYWGLAKRKPHDEDDDSKKTSGLWKPTRKGVRFVHRRITIPKYAVTFLGECERLEGVDVTVRDCLGQHFNYRKLMQETL